MSIYDYSVLTRKGEPFELSALRGKVLLIVNTATGCGFTPQYAALERLYEAYHDKGLEILDFPCNQFGHQAPGEDSEIHEFCTAKYKTQFDQFKKLEVNGGNEAPLYTFLKQAQPDEEIQGAKNKMAMAAIKRLSSTCKKPGDIKWNFTKFLIDKEGNVVERIEPTTSMEKVSDAIYRVMY